MNNNRLKYKIMGIISAVLLPNASTILMKKKCILKSGDIERMADALIAANIGDVRELNFEADHYYRMWQGALEELEYEKRHRKIAEEQLKKYDK